MRLFLRQVVALARKDLTIEVRSKEMLSAMAVFAFLVTVIFAFAFNPTRQTTKDVMPGLIWVGLTFATTIGLNRSFTSEKLNDTMVGLFLAPMDRAAIFFGKFLTNFLLVSLVEVINIPILFILFDYQWQGSLGALVLVLFLGTLGFSEVGTLLAAISANTRSSELLLPLLLFPIVVPLVIGAVATTGMALSGEVLESGASWLRLMGVYDVVFFVLPFILFEYVLEV